MVVQDWRLGKFKLPLITNYCFLFLVGIHQSKRREITGIEGKNSEKIKLKLYVMDN